MADGKISPSQQTPAYAPKSESIGPDQRERNRERKRKRRERKRQEPSPEPEGEGRAEDDDEIHHVDILAIAFQNETLRFKAVELSAGPQAEGKEMYVWRLEAMARALLVNSVAEGNQ